MKKISILLVTSLLVILSLFLTFKGTKASSSFVVLNGEENRTLAQNAIANSAYAFYFRGSNLQYNNHTVFSGNKVQLNTSYSLIPEHINSQNIEYNDCGHFIENIYVDTFTDINNEAYYISKPLDNDPLVPQSSINMHSNAAMYNEARKLNWQNEENIKCAKAGSNDSCKENEYYEIVNDSASSVGIYYYLNKNYVDDVANNNPINVTTGLTASKINDYKLGHDTASAIREQISNILQVGDVIIYSRLELKSGSISSSGHVAIYVGQDSNGKDRFMHSYGGSYNFDTKANYYEADGAIKYTKLCYNDDCSDNTRQYGGILDYCSDVTNEGTTSCQWQALRSNIYQIAVIRPLNHVISSNTYGLTENAIARNDYPKLVRTKESSINKYQSVNLDDAITYTITLENRGTETYSGINITDVVPTNTNYVSCSNNCAFNDGNISWSNITIPAGETKKYSYLVRVKDDISLNSKIISDQTIAAGIKMNTITLTVNKALTNSMQFKLLSEVNRMSHDSNYHPNYTRNFIQDVYEAVMDCNNDCNLGFDFSAFDNASNSILNYFYDVNDNIFTLKNAIPENEYTKMYIDGLFGGHNVSDGDLTDYFVTDGRVNSFNNDMLLIGDIIVLYDSNYQNALDVDTINISGEKDMYLYLGNGKFATVPRYKYENETVVSIAENNRQVTIIGDDNTTISPLIDSLMGQDAFVIIRPSYSLEGEMYSFKGDVNLDGDININDAIILAKYIINKTSNYDMMKLMLGDMNNDGVIRINDILALMNISTADK